MAPASLDLRSLLLVAISLQDREPFKWKIECVERAATSADEKEKLSKMVVADFRHPLRDARALDKEVLFLLGKHLALYYLNGPGPFVSRMQVASQHPPISWQVSRLVEADRVIAIKTNWRSTTRVAETTETNRSRNLIDRIEKGPVVFKEGNQIHGKPAESLSVMNGESVLDDLLENVRASTTAGVNEILARDEVIEERTHLSEGTEYRIWRASAFESLSPIIELGSKDKFIKCMREIFQGTFSVLLFDTKGTQMFISSPSLAVGRGSQALRRDPRKHDVPDFGRRRSSGCPL